MFNRSKLAIVAGALLTSAGVVQAELLPVTLNIYGSSAPNIYGSTNWSAWWFNSHSAIHDGLTTAGSGHSLYLQLSDTGGVSDPQAPYEAVVTGFDSWQGIAGGTGEYGHRIQYIYDIRADGYQSLSLANIADIQVYEDGWGNTGSPLLASPIAYDSTTTLDPLRRVAYAWDGTLITSGTIEAWDAAHPDNPVYEIVGTYGMAYAAYYGPGQYWYLPGDSPQDTLNRGIQDVGANLHAWTGTVSYEGAGVQTTIAFVSDPATLAVLAAGVALLRRWPRR